MHFLKSIVESPILEDPAQNHMEIHRHFYRYSKGVFIGPALKISRTSTKITLKGSHEYEDLIEELVLNSISDSQHEFEIKGTLITGADLSTTIEDLGFSWNLKASTGKTKNFKASVLSKTSKEQLKKAIDAFRKNSYFLISYTINPSCKVTTKKSIPQPSKKKIEEDDINQRIQFCNGALPVTESNIKRVIEESIPDFLNDLPGNWKTIIIMNYYKITDIVLPKNIKDSHMLRIMAIRKGKLIRTMEFDSKTIEKQYSIVV